MENQDNSGVTASGEVRKFDFEQFLAHGREKAQAPSDIMPWSFDFYNWAATHENNDRYTLSYNERTINFLRGDILEVHPDGSVVHAGRPSVGIHDTAITAEHAAASEQTESKPPITAEQSVETQVAAQEIATEQTDAQLVEIAKAVTEVKSTEQIDAMEGEGGGQPVPAPPAPVSHSEHEELKAKMAELEKENQKLKEEKAKKAATAAAMPKASTPANTKTDKPKSDQPR